MFKPGHRMVPCDGNIGGSGLAQHPLHGVAQLKLVARDVLVKDACEAISVEIVVATIVGEQRQIRWLHRERCGG